MLNKKILVGVSGGIAAYKVADLVRKLRQGGSSVQVVMTENAGQFVSALTLQTLSGQPVYSNLFDPEFEQNIGHIHLARWADVILIAPASANLIAKLAHGIADDLLTTLCLATSVPIVIAPAMNKFMWENQATIENVNKLKARGLFFIGPDSGEQACGEIGIGRMSEPDELCLWLSHFFQKPIFSGKKVLVTAGPTHEFIDPVRYISTRSSGTMGYAIAHAFAHLGAEVCLVSGPSSLACPSGVKRIAVISAEEMHQAVMQNLPADIFVGAAAVGDYRAELPSATKMKRHADFCTLTLSKNPDILAAAGNFQPRPWMVGFAAETDHHLEHAQEKLRKKNLDMIVLNAVENEQGFGPIPGSITILIKNGEQIQWPLQSKSEIARQLVTLIEKTWNRSL